MEEKDNECVLGVTTTNTDSTEQVVKETVEVCSNNDLFIYASETVCSDGRLAN